jgi:2-keto-4-pentenoate hydratase/2-oxohepta-3-ene-1,7-dioic acid hydratase in catechol pathway
MKLASFVRAGRPSYGLVEDDQLLDVGAVLAADHPTLKSLLAFGPEVPAIVRAAAPRAAALALGEVQFLPVIPDPAKIFCAGYNYMSHVEETGKTAPEEHPFLFTRFADSQAAHGQPLLRPKVSTRFDYQGALAVVIGKGGRHIARDRAMRHVAGYACYNEASVRDWQKHSTQFTAGKNFPQTGAFGPWLVTADEITDPTQLTVVTRHNGREVQRESVGNMLFDVAALIAYCSTFTPLSAGDVIVTGTPGGVGALYKPPLWLEPGVTVEVEIAGIGVLRNTVADEAAA